MLSPYAVCHKILAECEKRGWQVTPLKLTKLLYLSHGFHLGYTGKPLIEDDIEAWKYGPVIRRAYEAVRHFGGNKINSDLFRHSEEELNDAEPESLAIISAVIESYGELSGLELSTRTHLPGSPWEVTRKKNGHVYESRRITIPNDLIRDYYYGKINAG